MTRILHLTTDSKIAGAEKLLIGIAGEYDRSRFELLFCTLKKRGDLHAEIEKLSQKCYSLGYDNIICLPAAIIKLVQIIKRNKIDILHTHLFHAGIVGYLAGIFSGKTAVLITKHYSNMLYLYGNSFQRFLDRWVLKRAKHIIAISYGVKDILVRLDGIADKKISVIHNGIDLKRFDPLMDAGAKVRRELKIDDDVKIIGTVGIFHPRKGHEYLIRAADIVCRKRQDVKFLLVGDGILEERLVALRDLLDLREKVIFTGYRKDIPDLLSIMDIVVHPSLEEGFGLSIIEAMFSGKAVIATNVGGVPEIIENRLNGLLIPEKDPEAIADAIDYILSNPDKAGELGSNARSRVCERFSLSAMVKKYESVYGKIRGNICAA
ncbi:MAG: glycosyltransferase [Candidatus Omnitrophota bacterium]|nr:glycosyltransferase [Candidatus Omnitrophota bacterium]